MWAAAAQPPPSPPPPFPPPPPPPVCSPPDNLVTFYDVQIQWDNASPSNAAWSTGVVDQVCEFTAHNPVPSTTNGTVTITWNTAAQDPPAKLIAASQANRTLSGRAPAAAFPW